jgi:hypothetical protein
MRFLAPKSTIVTMPGTGTVDTFFVSTAEKPSGAARKKRQERIMVAKKICLTPATPD